LLYYNWSSIDDQFEDMKSLLKDVGGW